MKRWIARAWASETTLTVIVVVSLTTLFVPPCFREVCDVIYTAVDGSALPEPKEYPTCPCCGRSEYAVGRCWHCNRPDLIRIVRPTPLRSDCSKDAVVERPSR